MTVRRTRSARTGTGSVWLALFVACSCRASSDGSAAPPPSGTTEPTTPGPTVVAPTPGSEPSAQKAVAPVSVEEPSEQKPATPTSDLNAPADDGESLLLENLTNALRDTPFSAIVQHLRVDVVPLGSDEVKFVYQVRVLENIRGPKLKKLTYYSVAEKGEDPNSATGPVILTLCKDKDGYYWPGPGAQFPRTNSTSALVDRLKPELSPDQKLFEQCHAP